MPDDLMMVGGPQAPIAREAVEEPADDDRYWAARSESALVAELKAKETAFFEFCQRRGYTSMWSVILAEYFGMTSESFSFDSEGTWREGEDGEMIRFRINELRSVGRQLVNMITKGKAAFQGEAQNVEATTREQASMVDMLVPVIYGNVLNDRKERIMVERAKLYGKMWVWLRWDPDGGPRVPVEMRDPETGEAMLIDEQATGAVLAELVAPWNVIMEPTRDMDEQDQWVCVRERRSRWELLAELLSGNAEDEPALREHIKRARASDEVAYQAMYGFEADHVSDDDVIAKWFYHVPTQDLPRGRCALIVGDKILKETDWPGFPMTGAPQLPVVEYMPATIEGSALGYSDLWDLVPPQQVLTQLTSDMATNLTTFGRSIVIMDEGTDIRDEELVNGVTVLRKQAGQMIPQGLSLAEMPPFAPQMMQFVLQRMQSIAGLNSVRRGDPDDNIKSGTMAALFDSIAIENQSGDIAEFDALRGKVCSLAVALIQRFATVDQVVSIVGEGERAHAVAFNAETFAGYQRFNVKPVSPLMKSRANQLQMIEVLSKIPGAISTPQQAIELFTTGTVKPTTKAPEALSRRIEWENERLRKGVRVAPDPSWQPSMQEMQRAQATGVPPSPPRITPDVPVYPTDNPFTHVPEHFADIATETDPQIVDGVMAHIEWHLRVYQEATPVLAQVMGFPPPQMPMPMGPPPERPNEPKKALGAGKIRDVEQHGVALPRPAEPPPQAAAPQ